MGEDQVTVKPIKGDLLYKKIADAIIAYIKENGLKNGDKIPSERELAQEFNTSRNSVREALRVLERDHVIEVKRGKGAFITSEETETSFYMKLWQVNYIELLEVKAILEFHLIKSLCGNLTEAQIKSLEGPLVRLEHWAELGIYSQEDDSIFHNRIRKICSNSTMKQMLDSIVKSLEKYGGQLGGVSGIWCQTVPYHRELLNAMIENRPFAAHEAYRKIQDLDKEIFKLKQEIEQN